MSKSRYVIAATLAAGVLGASMYSAQAADMSYRSYANAPYTVNQPLNGYSWAGPYLGGNIGYQWGSIGNSGAKPSGIAGGLTAGYNWQSGSIVFGGETDIQLSGSDDRFASYKFANPWFGTIRGRVGYAMNNILIYATGGFAYGKVRGEYGASSQSHVNGGWTLGAGAEFGIYQNWTAKVEFLYVDLNRDSFFIPASSHDYNFGTLRVGVNYHF